MPAERSKPWGTAHAVLCCKDTVKEPFAVINADDFYGTDSFQKAYKFFTTEVSEKAQCIIGYELKKTLSDNGSVSRGVCEADADNNLISIIERTSIYRNEQGKITYEDETGLHEVSEDSLVSMNFFGFSPAIFGIIEKQFQEFLAENLNKPKAEFFIPLVGDKYIKSGEGVSKSNSN